MKSKFLLVAASALLLAACGNNNPASDSTPAQSGEGASNTSTASSTDSKAAEEARLNADAATALKSAVDKTVEGKKLGIHLGLDGTIDTNGMTYVADNFHIDVAAKADLKNGETMVTTDNIAASVVIGADRLEMIEKKDNTGPLEETEEEGVVIEDDSGEGEEEEEEEDGVLADWGLSVKYVQNDFYLDLSKLQFGSIEGFIPMILFMTGGFEAYQNYAKYEKYIKMALKNDKIYANIDDVMTYVDGISAMMGGAMGDDEESDEGGRLEAYRAAEEEEEEHFVKDLFDYSVITNAVNTYATEGMMSLGISMLRNLVNAEIAVNNGIYTVSVKTTYDNIAALANLIGPMTDEKWKDVKVDDIKKGIENLNEDNAFVVTFDENSIQSIAIGLEADYVTSSSASYVVDGEEMNPSEVKKNYTHIDAQLHIEMDANPVIEAPSASEHYKDIESIVTDVLAEYLKDQLLGGGSL